ncbi:hypothetical protein BDV32DRAFT_148864 [Aspergillus pseudonomiae]|uniref:Uncharacterized protein n=1 Tax=Aspergillus pseudonomiae TaxID=1506151 RepID=A0A5N7DF46_9EURO|nr:uncharacterized protein BDV37DRAFT_282351 [Aspergillus pseudonomiae]KAB8260993.1 hypothetical protein BDV32DRAFT_148864 [Aspergillus pseudonomiae]KAE8404815.1 hypothetical protein BDV37DRAFT_282351 [Aspergillus pseudonomiae]
MAKKPKIDTPRTETNNLAAKDEQTVTAMFIALVRELSALATQTPHTWTIERINFRATFKLKQHMTAEVDGAFWDRDTRLTKSIFEAKRKQRADIFDTVRMQEGAELAAWYAVADYNSLPGLNGRRILFSLNWKEAWVTFATPGSKYREYLSNGSFEKGRPEYYLKL